MNSQRISVQKHNQETFYKLYKFLFDDRHFKTLSDSAKIAYSLFRDRFNLSIENNWIDRKGHIYFVYTIKEICEILGCASQKATNIKKELERFGLLEQERVGLNKANRIYILEPQFNQNDNQNTVTTGNSDSQKTDVSKSNVRNDDSHKSGIVIITNHNWWISKSNKNYIIKTDINKTYYYNLNNLKQQPQKKASHSSNASKHSQQPGNSVSEDQYKKEFSFNKYPKLINLELKRLHFDNAKLLMDISNKAKRAVSSEYDDMKKEKESFDFSYEYHEVEISRIMNRMIQKAKFDNVSLNHLSRYISRSIQNYFRGYAEEILQEIIDRDMSNVDVDFMEFRR